jgi:hypothetical protein
MKVVTFLTRDNYPFRKFTVYNKKINPEWGQPITPNQVDLAKTLIFIQDGAVIAGEGVLDPKR